MATSICSRTPRVTKTLPASEASAPHQGDDFPPSAPTALPPMPIPQSLSKRTAATSADSQTDGGPGVWGQMGFRKMWVNLSSTISHFCDFGK